MESTVFDPRKLIPSFIYIWIMCGGRGKRKREEKKDFCCVKQTDEQRDPQRGCVMFGQPLFCVCSVFAWNSHDHQTPGYNTPGITLNTSHILTSELYIFLILVNLYKYTPELLTGKCHSPIFYPRSLFYFVDLVPAIMHVI